MLLTAISIERADRLTQTLNVRAAEKVEGLFNGVPVGQGHHHNRLSLLTRYNYLSLVIDHTVHNSLQVCARVRVCQNVHLSCSITCTVICTAFCTCARVNAS